MREIKPEAIYDVKEVAEMFGLAERTVKRLVYEGKLPGRKVASRIVFVGSELLQSLPQWTGRKKAI
jgi:hypothetical protein